MRAKRSKKYRKLMHQYELSFGFREPYQVLVDSNFLRAVHSFKMDLMPALERTLQGKVKPLLTKCSLAAIMASQPTNPKTNTPYRPTHLPPPTTLPLRHCSHNPDSTPIDEIDCLLSLLSPNPDAKKNKEHYILATADPTVPKSSTEDLTSGTGKKRKRGEGQDEAHEAMVRAKALRVRARAVPGVPIVYVKRSVMVLEPMSSPSEDVREGVERGKFRAGIEGPDSFEVRAGSGEKKKSGKKIKGPNPLSVKKPKTRAPESGAVKPREKRDDGEIVRDVGAEEDGDAAPKPKRKRRHHRSAKPDEAGQTAVGESSD